MPSSSDHKSSFGATKQVHTTKPPAPGSPRAFAMERRAEPGLRPLPGKALLRATRLGPTPKPLPPSAHLPLRRARSSSSESLVPPSRPFLQRTASPSHSFLRVTRFHRSTLLWTSPALRRTKPPSAPASFPPARPAGRPLRRPTPQDFGFWCQSVLPGGPDRRHI